MPRLGDPDGAILTLWAAGSRKSAKRFISDGTGCCVGCEGVGKTNAQNLCKRCWGRMRLDPAFRARIEANPRSGLGEGRR